jgi:hypothetical protein
MNDKLIYQKTFSWLLRILVVLAAVLALHGCG